MSEGQQKIRGQGRFWVEEEELSILEERCVDMDIFIYIYFIVLLLVHSPASHTSTGVSAEHCFC